MERKKPTIKQFGENGILITWPQCVQEDLLYFILGIKEGLKKKYSAENIEVINTYNALLLKFPFSIKDFEKKKVKLAEFIFSGTHKRELHRQLYTLPVCYDKDFGIDLQEVSQRNKLTVKEIVDLHTQPCYTVFFQGFLPGFLYLGGLKKQLHIARKEAPRLQLKKGAVGLAGSQTGVYPQDSAGGWQIIGNCPVNLFDPSCDPPTVFKAGDRLKFEAVSKKEYKTIEAKIKKGDFNLNAKTFKI